MPRSSSAAGRVGRALTLLPLLWVSCPLRLPAAAQEPAAAIRLDERHRGSLHVLTRPWRYRPGDDPAWADPALDDSDWALAPSSLLQAEEPPGGWPGIGWFRLRVTATEAFGDQPLGVFLSQAGASEIYLDGDRVAGFGTVSATPAGERAFTPRSVITLRLRPGVEHVLAVRYSNASGNVLPPDSFRGFRMVLSDMETLTAYGLRMLRQAVAVIAGAVGLFAAFALLHGLLFVFRPRAWENLWFALFALSMVALLLADLSMEALGELARMLVFFKVFVTASVAVALSALLLEHSVFHRRVTLTVQLFGAAAVVLLVWAWTRPVFFDLLPLWIFIGLAYLEALRLAVMALLRREPEAWVIGAGFVVLTLGFLLSIGCQLGLIPLSDQTHLALLVVMMGSLVLSFSIYLTRRVVRTNRELAERLGQIGELTEKTIAQERWKARQEAERRVLEADNRRKTEELEEARQLQLAMLPRELPELAGFDLAVHMTTANEVGGDYYDFRANGDGACTLAVGDATGHGVHAGMVVAVAKSLFQTSAGEGRLPAVLGRIGAGLASMHQRLASMAMVLLCLEEHRLRVASAGMPPVLVWRRAGGQMEEILEPGLPLGTLAGARFGEREVELAPGDTVLVMSDGLVETVDPAGEPLGYTRAAACFGASAHLEPQQIIDGLIACAGEHRAGAALLDDTTLVVLKTRG